MSVRSRADYLRAASAVAGLSAAAVLAAVAGVDPSLAPWCLAGLVPTAVIGLVSGARLAGQVGTPSLEFLVTLGAAMLGRLLVVLGSIVPLTQSGTPAFWSFMAGVAGGFVPLQAHEARLLTRAARRARA